MPREREVNGGAGPINVLAVLDDTAHFVGTGAVTIRFTADPDDVRFIFRWQATGLAEPVGHRAAEHRPVAGGQRHHRWRLHPGRRPRVRDLLLGGPGALLDWASSTGADGSRPQRASAAPSRM